MLRLLLKKIQIELLWDPYDEVRFFGIGTAIFGGLFLLGSLYSGSAGEGKGYGIAMGFAGVAIMGFSWLFRRILSKPLTELGHRKTELLDTETDLLDETETDLPEFDIAERTSDSMFPSGWSNAAKSNPSLARWGNICSFAAVIGVFLFFLILTKLFFDGGAYFVAVPTSCECTTTSISNELSDVVLLENSIHDANKVSGRVTT